MRDEPVQIDARLVLLPYSPLLQHLFHDVFIARESVDGEHVEPAEDQHAHSGPHRQLAPVASHQHLPRPPRLVRFPTGPNPPPRPDGVGV